jgi:hypothetical protein
MAAESVEREAVTLDVAAKALGVSGTGGSSLCDHWMCGVFGHP